MINSDHNVVIEMGDEGPTLCSDGSSPKEKKKRSGSYMKRTKILNSFLGLFVIGVIIISFSCGICLAYNMQCEVEKQTHDADLTGASNLSSFQRQILTQKFDILGMYNVTFTNDNSHLKLDTFLEGVFDILQIIEGIDKSLPPYSEGGIVMLHSELQDVIYQLEHDIQEAIKYIKKLQQSLKTKPRRRPPLYSQHKTWNIYT